MSGVVGCVKRSEIYGSCRRVARWLLKLSAPQIIIIPTYEAREGGRTEVCLALKNDAKMASSAVWRGAGGDINRR